VFRPLWPEHLFGRAVARATNFSRGRIDRGTIEMARSRLRAFRADSPSLDEEPKFFTQLPDDLDEDGELNRRPGPTGILRALLRLIRRSGSQDRSIVCTYADVGKEARVSVRTVKTHLERLRRHQYIEQNTFSGPRGWATRKTHFRVVYDLRPGFMLEADPPTISGSRDARLVKKSSPRQVKKSSPRQVKKSSPRLLFDRAPDQRSTTEENHHDDESSKPVVVVSSASPLESNPEDLSPIVERIRTLWPDEPLIDRRAAELSSRGIAEALLAIEYAELRPPGKGSGLAYAISTRNRWFCSGYDVTECEEEVRARRPKPQPATPIPAARRFQLPPVPPTPEEIGSTIEEADHADHPVCRRMFQRQIRDWLDQGLVPEDLIPSAQKAGWGSSDQLPPQPAGTINSVHPAPDQTPNHIVKGCACQVTEENGASGHCPPGDSNPERAD